MAQITGLDLELERGTDRSLNTPAEALAAEPSVDVLLCGFSSPQELGPAMLNIHWTEFSQRSTTIYEVTDRPDWGEGGFVEHSDESEGTSIAIAGLEYPGGGYWNVTALVPNEASSSTSATQWASEVGDLIARGDRAEAKAASGTADLSKEALVPHLGTTLAHQCADIDQNSTYYKGGGIGASADRISIEGMECDQLIALVSQISPALDDAGWRDRVSSPRITDIGGMSCYIGELDSASRVPVYCDDGRGTRASFMLVHVPEPG